MYGEKAYALIKECANNENTLPPYNTSLVQDVSNEIRTLVEQNQEDAQTSTEESGDSGSVVSTIRLRHAAVKRNLRCLIAYHYNRLRLLRTMRWEFGSILPADIKSNLSPAEIDWFAKYSRILASYMRSLGEDGLNLAVDLRPPKSLYIEVKCTVDYGRYEMNDGTVLLLKKDSRHYLPRSECEELIRQGVFEHIL